MPLLVYVMSLKFNLNIYWSPLYPQNEVIASDGSSFPTIDVNSSSVKSMLTPFGRRQLMNTLSPSSTTVLGISNDDNDVHPSNALSPIEDNIQSFFVEIVYSSYNDVNVVHPLNASFPID